MWSLSVVTTLQEFLAGVILAWKSRWPGDSPAGLGRHVLMFYRKQWWFLHGQHNWVETGYLGVRCDFPFTVWSWVSYPSFLNFSFFDYEMEWILILAPFQQRAFLLPKDLVKISLFHSMIRRFWRQVNGHPLFSTQSSMVNPPILRLLTFFFSCFVYSDFKLFLTSAKIFPFFSKSKSHVYHNH